MRLPTAFACVPIACAAIWLTAGIVEARQSGLPDVGHVVSNVADQTAVKTVVAAPGASVNSVANATAATAANAVKTTAAVANTASAASTVTSAGTAAVTSAAKDAGPAVSTSKPSQKSQPAPPPPPAPPTSATKSSGSPKVQAKPAAPAPAAQAVAREPEPVVAAVTAQPAAPVAREPEPVVAAVTALEPVTLAAVEPVTLAAVEPVVAALEPDGAAVEAVSAAGEPVHATIDALPDAVPTLNPVESATRYVVDRPTRQIIDTARPIDDERALQAVDCVAQCVEAAADALESLTSATPVGSAFETVTESVLDTAETALTPVIEVVGDVRGQEIIADLPLTTTSATSPTPSSPEVAVRPPTSAPAASPSPTASTAASTANSQPDDARAEAKNERPAFQTDQAAQRAVGLSESAPDAETTTSTDVALTPAAQAQTHLAQSTESENPAAAHQTRPWPADRDERMKSPTRAEPHTDTVIDVAGIEAGAGSDPSQWKPILAARSLALNDEDSTSAPPAESSAACLEDWRSRYSSIFGASADPVRAAATPRIEAPTAPMNDPTHSARPLDHRLVVPLAPSAAPSPMSSSGLSGSNSGPPGATPPVLGAVAVQETWRALWLSAPRHPPDVVLPNLAPPG